MKTYDRILSLVLSLALLASLGVSAAAGFASDSPAGEPVVRVINCESTVTVEYKETKYFEFEAEHLPDDAALYVFLNDENRGPGTYIYVEKPTED